MSLMTEACYADVMSSAVSVVGQDRVDLPVEADDWIRPSHTFREFTVTKNSTRPWRQIAPSRGRRGCGAKSFSTVPLRVNAMTAPHDIYIMHSLTAHCSHNSQPMYYITTNMHTACGVLKAG